MNLSRYITASILILLSTSSTETLAHGRGYWGGWGRPGFSFYFGLPLAYPPYYRPYVYPPYYYPPVYQVPAPPPVYIEPRRNPAYGSQNWAYCPSSDSYYPSVRECPEGWQMVSPYPAGQMPGYWYYCDEPAGYYPYVRQCYRPWRPITP